VRDVTCVQAQAQRMPWRYGCAARYSDLFARWAASRSAAPATPRFWSRNARLTRSRSTWSRVRCLCAAMALDMGTLSMAVTAARIHLADGFVCAPKDTTARGVGPPAPKQLVHRPL